MRFARRVRPPVPLPVVVVIIISVVVVVGAGKTWKSGAGPCGAWVWAVDGWVDNRGSIGDCFAAGSLPRRRAPGENPHTALFSHTLLKKSSARRRKAPDAPKRRGPRSDGAAGWVFWRGVARMIKGRMDDPVYPQYPQKRCPQPVENGNPGRERNVCAPGKSYAGFIPKKSPVIPKNGGKGGCRG